jgi:hypothetical protein
MYRREDVIGPSAVVSAPRVFQATWLSISNDDSYPRICTGSCFPPRLFDLLGLAMAFGPDKMLGTESPVS